MLKIELAEFGISYADGKMSRNAVSFSGEDRPHPNLLRYMSSLDELARSSGLPIVVPDRDFTRDEINTMERITEVMATGSYSATWTTMQLEVEWTKEDYEHELRRYTTPEGLAIRVEQEEQISVFGYSIGMGVVQNDFTHAKLANLDELRGGFMGQGGTEPQRFTLRFEPGDDDTVTVRYLNMTGNTDAPSTK